MNKYEDTKYFTDKEHIHETLHEYGVAIIPSVLNQDECEILFGQMWNFFEYITQTWEIPIDRNNSETWEQFYKLYPNHSMLVQYYQIGHAQFAWNARQNEKIVDIFAYFWNCKMDELLVSFDASSFHLPPEFTGIGFHENGDEWYHTDQSYQRNIFECIQSFVSLIETREGDATLAFMEGSHKYHKEFAEKFVESKNQSKDFYRLNNQEIEFYESQNCAYKKIKCPQGSLVIWDSRTIHCGVKPLPEREISNIRAIIYLCYMPRYLASQENICQKQKALINLRTTTHWAYKAILFPISPSVYGFEVKETTNISSPKLTKLGLTLAGFSHENDSMV